MKKAILIDENGNANGVYVQESTEIGETGNFDLVDNSEVDYSSVYGEIVEIE